MSFICQRLIKQGSTGLGTVLPLIQYLSKSIYICFPADRKPIRCSYMAIHPRLLQCRISHFPKNHRVATLFIGSIFRTSLCKVTGKETLDSFPKSSWKKYLCITRVKDVQTVEWKGRTKLWISVTRKFLWNSAMFHAMVHFMGIYFGLFCLGFFNYVFFTHLEASVWCDFYCGLHLSLAIFSNF